MKLRFDPDQPHQHAAIDAVLGVWRGQPRVSVAAALGAGAEHGVVANRLDLSPTRVLANLHAVQSAAGLPRTALADDGGPEACPQISVEMETGTGKTYVYLRTALELARRHGVRKFVIVVPSVAVREGVLQTLRSTREHFASRYGGLGYRYFAYDGARLGRLRTFARSSEVELMVLTLDAFNKARNRMRRAHDAFSGRAPLGMLAAVRPVLVLDEPQRMESTNSRAALADLAPLFVLRYGATHRRRHALVHRLTPRQAHERGLVKRIEVAAPATELEDREARMSAQLRATVELHLRRQAELLPRGIKVLSLLFVDRVSDWVDEGGVVRRELSRWFQALKGGHPRFAALRPESVCAAYFAEARRGGRTRAVDSRTGRSLADEQAYALIMRDKERLLSLDEPVAFIVSHSALREGWDNPNVFQICTLAQSRSSIKKRQEIGRGVRLAVDQRGERCFDPQVNVLTVVANGSYDTYVAGLQAEDAEELDAEAIAPPPPRAGEAGGGRGTTPAPVGPPPWRSIDPVRLRAEALALAGGRTEAPSGSEALDDAEHDDPAAAVTELLLRRRPPCLVSRSTIDAVLVAASSGDRASWSTIERAALAIVDALHHQLERP